MKGFNSILDTVEQQIGELKERWVENFQFEEKKMIENTEKSIRDIWDMMKWLNVYN